MRVLTNAALVLERFAPVFARASGGTALATRACMLELAAILPVALLSVPHCAAMCGPLAACATRCDRPRQIGYQIGRVLAYAGAGALAGGVGRTLADLISAPWITAIATWLVALALVVAAISMFARPRFSFYRGGDPPPVTIGKRRRLLKGPATLFGALTVFLPCGALWAALAIAISTRSAVGGAGAMLVFAVITGVAVAGGAAICHRLRRTRWLMAAALVTGAVLLAIAPAAQLGDNNSAPVCPLHQPR